MTSPIRFTAACVAVLLLLQADAAFASQASLLGIWRGSAVVKNIKPIFVDLIFYPNGHFAERIIHEPLTVADFGTYAEDAHGSLTLHVLRACGRFGCRGLPKPHNVEYRLKSISATGMVLQEKKYGGLVVFKHLRQAPAVKRVPKAFTKHSAEIEVP